jgi:hypothetical protein
MLQTFKSLNKLEKIVKTIEKNINKYNKLVNQREWLPYNIVHHWLYDIKNAREMLQEEKYTHRVWECSWEWTSQKADIPRPEWLDI